MKRETILIILFSFAHIALIISIWSLDVGVGILLNGNTMIATNGWIDLTGMQLYHLAMYGIIFFAFMLFVIAILWVDRR